MVKIRYTPGVTESQKQRDENYEYAMGSARTSNALGKFFGLGERYDLKDDHVRRNVIRGLASSNGDSPDEYGFNNITDRWDYDKKAKYYSDKREAVAAGKRSAKQQNYNRHHNPNNGMFQQIRTAENLQEVKTGKERANHRYSKKVRTKSGKIRYIYDTKNQPTNKKNSPNTFDPGKIANDIGKGISDVTKSIGNASSGLINSGKSFIEGIRNFKLPF